MVTITSTDTDSSGGARDEVPKCWAKCPRDASFEFSRIGGIELSQQYDCVRPIEHDMPHRNQFRTEWTDEDLARAYMYQ